MATDREDCSRRCGSAVSAGTTRYLRWHRSWRRTRQKWAWDCRLLGSLVRRPTAQLSPHGIRSTIEGATPHHPPGCSGSLRKWHLYKALKGSLHKHRGCAWFLSILYIFLSLRTVLLSFKGKVTKRGGWPYWQLPQEGDEEERKPFFWVWLMEAQQAAAWQKGSSFRETVEKP